MDKPVTKKPFEAGARRKLEAMSCEDLDELVHGIKEVEAATINNSGKDSQIEYLLGNEVNKPPKKYYRTVYKFEVLSDEPMPDIIDIDTIHYELTADLLSGMFLDSEVEECNEERITELLKKQGSDSSFFTEKIDE